jgi:poly-gamma-glutamate synthesis protein (capsule biosynthesis protein)
VRPDVVPDKSAPPAPAPAETSTPEPTAPTAPPEPEFSSSISEITPELAARMAASWRPGCPVPLESLRYVTVSHVDFDGVVQTGELVLHAEVAEPVVGVFAALFEARYPIRLMRLVDDFGADDTASMEADNTSAFNCRAITGGTGWSEHAYGKALDLNPVENPYVIGNHVAPEAGRAFVDRPDLPGVVHADDLVVQAFAAAGWHWGGYWSSPVDYQHFSLTGR